MKKKNIPYVLLGGAILIGIVALVVWQSKPIEGTQTIANLGNQHIDTVTSPHAHYNSSPPTSGPHIGSIAPWGVSDEPIPNERQVHNLEDGGVMVQYHPDRLTNEQVAELTEAAISVGRKHVIVAPYLEMEHAIAVSAWNRLLALESVDADLIGEFIRKYEGLDHHAR